MRCFQKSSFCRFVRVFAHVWALVAGSCAAVAQEPGSGEGPGKADVASDRVFTTSSSGRFMVSGPDASGNMGFSRWAEGSADQLERFTGVKFPFRRGRIVEIRQVSGPGDTGLQILREGEGFRRVITIGPAAGDDPERLDELLCRALVAGYMEEHRRRGGEQPLPEWLTMGLAQNLRMEQRVRNRSLVTVMRMNGALPGVGDFTRWQFLPAGWPRYRSLCGMLVAWIGTYGEKDSPYARILGRLAEGGTVTPEWLAVEVTGSGSIQGMEAAWHAWVGRQGSLVQTFGELSLVLIAQLEAEIPLVMGGGGMGEWGVTLSPREAIRQRGTPAVAAAALEKAQRLRVLTLGKAPELVAAGEGFARVYEDLANGAPGMLLWFELRRAESDLDGLADLTRRRESYLDAVEKELGSKRPSGSATGERWSPVLEKGALERYVDGVERKSLDTRKKTGGE